VNKFGISAYKQMSVYSQLYTSKMFVGSDILKCLYLLIKNQKRFSDHLWTRRWKTIHVHFTHLSSTNKLIYTIIIQLPDEGKTKITTT